MIMFVPDKFALKFYQFDLFMRKYLGQRQYSYYQKIEKSYLKFYNLCQANLRQQSM